jgi:hypothetical protein
MNKELSLKLQEADIKSPTVVKGSGDRDLLGSGSKVFKQGHSQEAGTKQRQTRSAQTKT